MKTTSNSCEGFNFKILLRKSKEMTKLPPRWAISSSRHFRIKWGLEVGKDLENPYQHLGSNITKIPTGKKFGLH
jgi:hypothetical protein